MLLELKNIQKTYSTKTGVTFRALNNVSLSFEGKGLVYIVGASGSGKSTLLNVIGGLDSYDSGIYTLAGKKMNALRGSEVDSLRNKLMGFVFQEFNLLDTLSVFDNVKLALDMQSRKDNEAVHNALKAMGIDDKAKNKTKDLSGGQRQRVAIARALVKDPRIILADEPTGALDSATTDEVVKILKDLSKDRLVLVVTHDMDMAAKTGDRIIEMKDGCVYRDVRRRGENEVVTETDTQVYSETLMSVPVGVKVGDDDVAHLNEIMAQSMRKTYVNVESDPRKVKALFPNLREAVNSGGKKQVNADAEDSALASDEFLPYKRVDTPMESVEFKKSRLPLLKSMRLALNNLNYKKGRLVLTLIISFIAFVLFGVAQSFTAFDVRTAYANTIREEDYKSAVITTAGGESRIVTADYDRLMTSLSLEKDPPKKYDMTFTPPSGQGGLYGNTLSKFDGVVEIDSITDCGYSVLYGSGAPKGTDGVVISEYAALSLFESRAVNGNDISDLIGMTLTMNDGVNFIIDGIFVCDNAEELFRDLDESMTVDVKLRNGWGQLYVAKGFVDMYSNMMFSSGSTVSLQIGGDSIDSAERDMMKTNTLEFIPKGTVPDGYEVIPVVGTGVIEREGDILLSRQSVNQIIMSGGDNYADLRAKAIAINADTTHYMTIKDHYNVANYATSDFRIVGIVEGMDSYSDMRIYLGEDEKQKIVDNVFYPVALCMSIDGMDANKLVNAVYDNGFVINAEYIENYSMVLALIAVLRYVLLGISLLFCLLVVVLLFSFISTSIRLTRKQIGILRALGAKKSDTFKIYAVEGFLVTVFALVLSIITIAIGAPILNALVGTMFGHYFSLFTIGAVVYITMAALTLVVTAIAVVIPLRKFNKITPVSAISGK